MLMAILPGVPELVLILLIIFITFGLGKLGTIGEMVARLRKRVTKQLDDADPSPIDITPEDELHDGEASSEPKPGKRKEPIEDADLDAVET